MSPPDAKDLEARLAELRADVQKERELEAELSDTARLLDRLEGDRARPSPLDDVRVASPCGESWDGMVGDQRARFCLKCAKNVYDLSAMTEPEAVALLEAREGEICVRFYRREDGTVMTSDCPVGQRKKRVRLAIFGAAGAGVLGAAAAMAAFPTHGVCSPPPPRRPIATELPEPAPTATAPREKPHVIQGAMPPRRPPPRAVMGKPPK